MNFGLALSCLIFIVLTGCFNEAQAKKIIHSPIIQRIAIENVDSLQVVGGLPGTKGSLLFQKDDTRGKVIITKIIGWINSAKPINGQTEYGKHGYPMFINMKMNDGKIVSVEPAYDCISKTNADGSKSKTCTPAKGEVVISDNSNITRTESSELYEWLIEGWKQE